MRGLEDVVKGFSEEWKVECPEVIVPLSSEIVRYRISSGEKWVSIILEKRDSRLIDRGYSGYFWSVMAYDMEPEIQLESDDSEGLLKELYRALN